MFDSKPVVIHIPPGPYPTCGQPRAERPGAAVALPCQGTLVPKLHSVKGAVNLYWQCSLCGRKA